MPVLVNVTLKCDHCKAKKQVECEYDAGSQGIPKLRYPNLNGWRVCNDPECGMYVECPKHTPGKMLGF